MSVDDSPAARIDSAAHSTLDAQLDAAAHLAAEMTSPRPEGSLSPPTEKGALILNAAMALFAEHGLAGTSMAAVARRAGVAKQTVYSHFGSKDALFAEAIAERCRAYQLTETLLADARHPDVALQEFAGHFARLVIAPQSLQLFRSCVAQAGSHPDAAERFYQAGPARILALLGDYLERVQQLGHYRFPCCHDSAVRLCLMLFGELRLRLELGLDDKGLQRKRDGYVAETVRLFLTGHKVSNTVAD